MKRYLSIFLNLCLCLCICGCDGNVIKAENTMDISEEVSERILVRAVLRGWGEEVTLDKEDDLAELQRLLNSFEFSVAAVSSEQTPPGSATLGITLEYSDGSIDEMTLPWNETDGKIYITDSSAVKIISDAFFVSFSEETIANDVISN